ncbi:dapE [Wigglesworthia glossinidia endosymbiont of Glossina brevipalpis]|uniref:Succinyl-diaminopimelate desuccinylase n=1 Tax=Wigglesworthia glossinidia brevipalpis TaxID=36870 RepID=DAPE_WIGBR|nr:RecName: Full=Succinyl-diaminopimelate desuccinylase; Short=SDAP desuccinylase; AltName: Full=N-succinyl-LL-2,6-diaminoheptanedioate amidohydrolase [Wigglesworthia glossinidia endosymbiont of Glossina brevipalpis]BAC24428.1 dapE [Wigglesworthia glossinidia endosymbiont of Glossina brevipalpis]
MNIVEIAKNLIKCQSLSPYDAGCNKIIIKCLHNMGFYVEKMKFGKTENIWAYKGTGYTLLFAGHTDVVHAGNVKNWKYPPFSSKLKDGILYGRGSADMKGALAAMLIAAKKFFKSYKEPKGRLAFLITSDEEGSGSNGTKKVINVLLKRKEKIDCCLIGEPTGEKNIGDIVKNGRRGSLSVKIIIYGKQNHVAYAENNNNPIYHSNKIIGELLKTSWNDVQCILPKTTMQIIGIRSNIKKFTNITPSKVEIIINFRFNFKSNKKIIKEKIVSILKKYKYFYDIKCILHSDPFFTKTGNLLKSVIESVKIYQKITPCIINSGGTSDGRFIYKISKQIIELGLLNKTIHKDNEHIKVKDLLILCNIYQYILKKILIKN